MDVDVKASQDEERPVACPLEAPTFGRVPGLLALTAVTAGVFIQPAFFALVGGLLSILSLLLSPPHCRLLGLVALVASTIVGLRTFL